MFAPLWRENLDKGEPVKIFVLVSLMSLSFAYLAQAQEWKVIRCSDGEKTVSCKNLPRCVVVQINDKFLGIAGSMPVTRAGESNRVREELQKLEDLGQCALLPDILRKKP